MSSILENKISFGKAIKTFMGLKDLRVIDVAKGTGVSRSAVYQWINDMIVPEADKIYALSSLLDVEMADYLPDEKAELKNFLLKNKSRLTLDDVELPESPSEILSATYSENYIMVPLLDIEATASFVESYPVSNHGYSGSSYPVMIQPSEYESKRYVVVSVKGDSMEPQIPDGCKVLCSLVNENSYRYVRGVHAVSLKSGIWTIKRITKVENNLMHLVADNPLRPESLDVELAEIQIMWKVEAVVSHRNVS